MELSTPFIEYFNEILLSFIENGMMKKWLKLNLNNNRETKIEHELSVKFNFHILFIINK